MGERGAGEGRTTHFLVAVRAKTPLNPSGDHLGEHRRRGFRTQNDAISTVWVARTSAHGFAVFARPNRPPACAGDGKRE